jgi:hypothetical protein
MLPELATVSIFLLMLNFEKRTEKSNEEIMCGIES